MREEKLIKILEMVIEKNPDLLYRSDVDTSISNADKYIFLKIGFHPRLNSHYEVWSYKKKK